MCFMFHKWTRWEQYVWAGKFYGYRMKPTPNDAVNVTERRQKRHCERCGKEQDELVRNG